MRKVQLLVHFLLQLLVVQRNLLLSVLVAPLECLQSVSFWKTVNVNEFCSGGVDGVVNFLILLSNVSQDFLFLLFIPAVDNALLVFEATEGFVKTKDFICCFFVNLFGFLDGARLSFFDLIFDGGQVFFCIIGILIDLVEFFLLESLDITAGIFVDFLDVVLGEVLFVFFNDILFDVVVSIESDGSVSDTGSAAHRKDNNFYKIKWNLNIFSLNCYGSYE